MHTPDQARSLWCPMVRIARYEVVTIEGSPIGNLTPVRNEHHVVAGCNTDALGGNRVPASCRCIADQCAMWRWVPGEGYDLERRVREEPVMQTTGGVKMRMTEYDEQVPNAPTHGYCGIAGRPGAAL